MAFTSQLRKQDRYEITDIQESWLQQQAYTIYRDFRSWTASATFRVTNDSGQSANYTVAVMFSLKASPTYGLGSDAVNRYGLVGE